MILQQSRPSFAGVVGLLLGFLLSVPAAAQGPFSGRKFVVDAGHGGADPGAVGIDGGAVPNEEDFVLDVAQRLRTKLEAAGAVVVMTRTTDTTVSLTARRDLTNAEDPDAFLSIHCNSFGSSSANGTETFWWTSGTSQDQLLATKVQNRMIAAFGLTNRGVKQDNFTVITSNPPAVLGEMMFISNQAEFDLMNTPTTRESAAQAFYLAFGDFLGIDLSAPVINTQPGNQIVDAGQPASFTVAATGAALTYRWRRNGVNLNNGGRISGATLPTLNITGAQFSDTGFYTVAVTSGSSTTISNPGQLVLNSTPSPVGSGSGLRGTYFDNPDFTALRRARVDATVNFDWAAGAPSSTMQPDTFSARWTGQIEPRYSQLYQFHVRSDEGVRLWVNGTLLIDKFVNQAATEWSGNIALTAGQKYDIRLDYFENTGDALAELRWSSPSQVKEIIPSAQLYRPPPVLVATPTATVLQGQPLGVTVSSASFDPLLSSQPWADFEGISSGTTDLVLFRKPGFSSSTSAFTDALKTRDTTVVSTFPGGNASSRALQVKWSWAPGAVSPWLRLTTFGAATLPNPVIDFRKALRFDIHSQSALKLGLGLRETNSTGAIASDGGSTGPIEFVGVSAVTGGAPVPSRTVAAGSWSSVEFDLPAEGVRAFTGNGLLESTTGLGVLEHLAFVPGSAAADQDIYLDNFVVVEHNRLTYSLVSGPAGATIDPNTGAISWNPTAAQAGASYTFTIMVSDAGAPPVSATTSFTVIAAPIPELLGVVNNGSQLIFSWKAAPGAKYDIETALEPNGPWSFVTEVTATSTTATHAAPVSGTQRFYRARLK